MYVRVFIIHQLYPTDRINTRKIDHKGGFCH